MNDITMTLSSPEVSLVEGKGSLTVSVTNASTASQRIVLGAFPVASGDAGATDTEAPSVAPIANVDRPLRTVAVGATEQYTVSFDVSQSNPGAYPVRLIGYSADRAPEEYADQAQTVTLTVAAKEEPVKKFPWWIVILAGAILVAAAIAGVVYFVTRSEPIPTPTPSPATSAPSIATVSVTVNITGEGTVGLAGTQCSSDCTVDVPSGTAFSPTQSASFAFVFDGWGADCPTSSDCTLSATTDVVLQATFRSIPVSSEDCLPYNKDGLAIADEGANGWLLRDGGSRMLLLDNQADATAALAVAEFYSVQCFVGRPQPEMTYWNGGSVLRAPSVAAPDCISHDPDALQIVPSGPTWRLTAGSQLLATLSSEADAGRALMVARGASQRCFIGRDQPPAETEYWLPRALSIQVNQGSAPTAATNE